MILTAFVMAASLGTITLHVSPKGDDQNPGTYDRPCRSFEGARNAARRHKGTPVLVEFESGTYRISGPIVFTEEDSGQVTYQPRKGSSVVISGSTEFRPSWKSYKGDIVQCSVPADFDTDQLFVNGEAQTLARYPNADPSIRIFQGYSRDAISPERVAKWSNPKGGFFHAMHTAMWGDFHFQILGKDANGKLEMEGGWQNNRRMGNHAEYRFVEGIFEELDAPGEWFLDRDQHILYYYPKPGLNLDSKIVEGVSTRSLIEFRQAKGIKLSGFTFQHTARTFMDNKEPLLRSDWTTYRGGAILFNGSQDCQIEDSTFTNLGGSAIYVDGMNRNLAIRRCQIHDVGANGIAFVGRPDAVRNPLFEYNERQSSEKIDKESGPKSPNYPSKCLVEDCLIYRTGRVEKQTAPVQIAMSSQITVRHCSIYEVPRAGINIGDGCWGGHIIEGCDVFDTVLETGDHGSFNSWGRDRYWGLTDVDMNLGEHPELADLDAVKPNILRNNRWRCDHGWDIDLDDGSSNYIIQNNLCLKGGLKNREGFNRLVENNVIVGNSFHPHVWFKNSGDVFRENIVFTPYQPIQVGMPWGKEVDRNFLHRPGKPPQRATGLAKQSGRDQNSFEGDALFENPLVGDFRVKKNSPALHVGFRNFAMNNFGVRPRNLKTIARRPNLSDIAGIEVQATKETEWSGAILKDLIDLGDISASGSAKNSGVFVKSIKPGSQAEKLKLKALDVIRQLNGRPTTSVAEFLKIVESGQVQTLTVWRNQQLITLRIP